MIILFRTFELFMLTFDPSKELKSAVYVISAMRTLLLDYKPP